MTNKQKRTRYAATIKQAFDPAVLLVAVILIAGIAGIGTISFLKSQSTSSPQDSSAFIGTPQTAASSVRINDAATNSSNAPVPTEEREEAELPDINAQESASFEKEQSNNNDTFDAVTYFAQEHTNAQGQAVHEPLLIGDSVAAGAVDAFYQNFPHGLIDAVVSRNIWESPYPTYRDEGSVGNIIIFCLGTNNAVVDWQIDDELLNTVEDDKIVFFVNTRSNQDWTESTNLELATAVDRHPNLAGVIDWYSYSEGHNEWFAGDGTHLTDEGCTIYMNFIYDSVVSYLNEHPLTT